MTQSDSKKTVSRQLAKQPSLPQRYLQEHFRVLGVSLGKLVRNPWSALFTAAAIGITLSLPAGLHVAVKNLGGLSHSWEGTVQASLFLKDTVKKSEGQRLTIRLNKRSEISKALYISRDEALKEFRETSGFGDALDMLEDNPLPAVVVVQPDASLAPGAVKKLLYELERLPEVGQVRLDQAWLERLHAILDIAELTIRIIAALLALAVIVIVGNTIRLDIQNRREEIEVLKLLGATDAFIRRPFLYAGALYGLTGGLLALVFVLIGLSALNTGVKNLAGLYDSDFMLTGLGVQAGLILILVGVLLGWLGSWWTVARHLKSIEPT